MANLVKRVGIAERPKGQGQTRSDQQRERAPGSLGQAAEHHWFLLVPVAQAGQACHCCPALITITGESGAQKWVEFGVESNFTLAVGMLQEG